MLIENKRILNFAIKINLRIKNLYVYANWFINIKAIKCECRDIMNKKEDRPSMSSET